MSYKDLRGFISDLEKSSDLIRVKEQVSSFLEITEIHRRVIRNKGPAIIFENVITSHNKSSMPVLVNLFGTIERIAAGIGITRNKLKDVGNLLAYLRSPTPPHGFKDALKMVPLLKDLMTTIPKTINNAVCQEVVLLGKEVDLYKIPIQTCWPQEPAPLITWPIVVTHGPSKAKDDSFNLGIYRMQVVNKNTTLMRWLKHRGGARQYSRWKQQGYIKDFPVAVVIGTDPATIIAAVTPIPETLSEYQFSGLLRKKSLYLTNCITVPLKVPANAEIVLEGFVSLNEYGDEGPYGDHTGYYNTVEKFPKFNVTAMTMRKSPIYLSTFTGKPPDEPSVLGEALNEIFIPILMSQYPEVVDFWLPPEGCSYRMAVVSIKKSYPGHAKRIIMGIFSFLTQFLYVKFVIIVDDDINIRDWKEVIWAMSTRMDPIRDMTFIERSPIDYLDFASTEDGLGSKVGLDATNKIYPETSRDWGIPIQMTEEIIEKVTSKWSKYGL
ncbi:UbiD family decarboxylase [Neoehrlichia mikurensis]|uniref:UbiD family decarboxylase n=1 Tax=Neoehrlichia mikurensis TaxID=89586 RepID=A0A9Q9BYP4_9RICK|nr:UbiD family decarboxylase [Neoehrlichia mikurensis]QXK91594.1 UbiD family decarboxylase [Neoehrlichia mikurensis]QXK92805.1 UbiD family decarboxylase [Neoehrlichia mikurensis]QXK93284.1 UbiD family decarboxylase [Neoehrlichia mikurensis]UTO55786.1 UbiD family decarboxylase [Neoehrlichia mikurensis]UTO56701.1 UbiD family decarboxylase [Neoehrlichia mikurensis]